MALAVLGGELRGLRQKLKLRARFGLAIGSEQHDPRRLVGLSRLPEKLRGPRQVTPELGRLRRRGVPTLAKNAIDERHAEKSRGL